MRRLATRRVPPDSIRLRISKSREEFSCGGGRDQAVPQGLATQDPADLTEYFDVKTGRRLGTDEHQDEPFFVALWPYTVHWPMDAPQELVDKYADRPGFEDYGDGVESSTLTLQ